MKPYPTQNILRSLGLAGLLATAALPVLAASFTATDDDLILAFRQAGKPDLVVNIGQVSKYKAVAPGNSIGITNTPTGLSTLLGLAYPATLNTLNWSVTGAQRQPGSFPIQTIWLSAPRADVATQTSPWSRAGQFVQGDPASQISAIGFNAATYSSAHPSGVSNNVSAVIIPSTDANAYTPLISDPFNASSSDLGGAWGQGNLENTTPFDFDTDEPLSVSDLYELQPSRPGGPGTFLGYFSFTPDGKVTFTAPSVAPAQPNITSVTRVGNVTTVFFTTQSGFNYSLLSTNQAGLTSPKSTWPATGASLTGTGAILSLTDTSAAGNAYYAIKAQ